MEAVGGLGPRAADEIVSAPAGVPGDVLAAELVGAMAECVSVSYCRSVELAAVAAGPAAQAAVE